MMTQQDQTHASAETESDPASYTKAMAGKRVLVIGGGGGGNGRAITRRLAKAGAAAVAVVDIDEARSREAVDEFEVDGVRGLALSANVRSSAEIEAAVSRAAEEFGGLDVLVTVVGGIGMFMPWKSLDSTTYDEWRMIFDVNLDYVFNAVRTAIPVFLEGGGGTIVSIGSISGTVANPMGGAYGAAKAGLINLAATVSVEYGRRGIRMNVVNCGLIATPAVQVSLTPEITSTIPMGRPGSPEEVAEAVLFLASDASAYISGQAINLDGAVTQRFPLAMPGTDRSMAG
jgi:3-oxoacyl-[acyl-carrier protein] reductase